METFEGAQTRTLGQRLGEERERLGMARAEAAQRLHMSPWQIEALEGGDYGRLPKGTFLRGFVRNYARLLHLDAEQMVALLPEAPPADKAAGNIVPPSEKIRFEPMGERAGPLVRALVVALVLVALGFASLYWWFFVKDTPPAADVRRPAATAAAPAPSGGPQQVAAAPVPPAEAPPPVDAPKDEAPPASAAASASTPPQTPAAAVPAAVEPARREPRKGERRLAFRFTGDSWIEVRDAAGRTLMSKLNLAGTEAEVSGRAPFTVIVGNAPEVRMTFDDRPYDLQPHSRVGVARLTVQ